MTDIKDSYIIGAYWGSRAEPLSNVVDKIFHTLNELKEIDVQFLKYYELGMSRKKALENEVTLNKENVKKICLSSVKKGELDENGIAKLGFVLWVWTGHKDEESSSVNFTVGGTYKTKNISNLCVLKIPHEGAARERMLQGGISKKILDLIVSTWNPDYAVLTSDSLRDQLNVGNEWGWITYRRMISHIPDLGDSITYEKDVQGHWFYVNSIGHFAGNVIEDLSKLSKDISNGSK